MKRKLLILCTLLLTLGAITNFGTNTGFAQEDPGFEWESGGGGIQTDCQLQAFVKADRCNTGYSNAYQAWQRSPTTCTTQCSSQATIDQERNQCISSCGPSDTTCINMCVAERRVNCLPNCLGAAQSNYYSTADNYGSCLANATTCQAQLDFCTGARIEAQICANQYSGNPETMDLFMSCRAASGVDMCQ